MLAVFPEVLESQVGGTCGGDGLRIRHGDQTELLLGLPEPSEYEDIKRHTSSGWRLSEASQGIRGHWKITESVLPLEKEAASPALLFFSLLLEIKCY